MTVPRVAVVGAGRRARETILPALYCLGDAIEVADVYTRSPRTISLLDGALKVESRTDLPKANLGDVDAVVVCVGLSQVPEVLGALSAGDPSHLRLLLDTPVVRPQDIGQLLRFGQFRDVAVSEDCIALPPFTLARRLVEEGVLGRLRSVYLFHSGYRHHALATLQQLVGVGRPTRVRVRRLSGACAQIDVRFRNGVTATIVEPRRYASGRFLIVGELAFLVDYPFDHRDAHQIGYVVEDGLYRGLLLDGQPVEPSELDRAFATAIRPGLEDDSLMALMKIRGFMEIVDAFVKDKPSLRYDPLQAIQDNVSLQIAERMGVFVDIPLGAATGVFGSSLRGAARVAAARRRGPGRNRAVSQ